MDVAVSFVARCGFSSWPLVPLRYLRPCKLRPSLTKRATRANSTRRCAIVLPSFELRSCGQERGNDTAMTADTLLDLVARVLRASRTASCMFLGITKNFASSSLLVTSCMCSFSYLACVYEFYILELPVLGSRNPFIATRKRRQVCKINYEICQMLPEAHSTKSQCCGIISTRSWFISRPNRMYHR